MRPMPFLVVAVLISSGATATASECYKADTPEQQGKPGDCFFTFTIENDLFGAGTDRHYTNGWRAALYNSEQRSPEFLGFVEENIPFIEIPQDTSVVYSLGQNLYTPEDIGRRDPDPQDRPYAAFLYGSIGYTIEREGHRDEVELTLGVIGPEAIGEGTQSTVHEVINSTDPRGWDHQLDTEPGLIISGQRSWTDLPAAALGGLGFHFVPHVGGSVGNVYTYASAGGTLHMGPSRYGVQSAPMRVRPAIPGNGDFHVPKDEAAWSLFIGAEGRAVGRNIFLDGNSFKSSASVEKKNFVADASAGVTLTYGWLRTSYTINWRSLEFEGQKGESVFGAISAGVRF